MIKAPHTVYVKFVNCHVHQEQDAHTKSIIVFSDPPLIPVYNFASAIKLRGRYEHTSYSSSQGRIRHHRYLGSFTDPQNNEPDA